MSYKDPQKKRDYDRKYYKEHKEELNKYSKEWRKKNPERANAICRKYRDTNRQRYTDNLAVWRKNNIERVRETRRKLSKRYRATIEGTLNHRMGVVIRRSLKKNKNGRRWEKLVGYTLDDLKQYLEKLFTSDMNWDRFLKGEIHIDHIKPRSLFHYKTTEDPEFKKCWALENLQPLEAIVNIKKSNHYVSK